MIYFDALFFVKNDFQNPGVLHTQCVFVEAMPKKLDSQINQDILAFFEQNKKVAGTKEANIPDLLLETIRRNAVDKKDPLQ